MSADVVFNHELLLQVCTVLSITVICLNLIVKFPQIYIIINSGSSFGISLASVVLELISFSIVMVYAFAMGHPLLSYFENVMFSVQDLILTGVILHNRNQFSRRVIPCYLLYMAGCTIIALGLLPGALMASTVFISAAILIVSKWYQLKTILKLKSSGRVSSLSWIITTYNTAVRMLTTAVITKDVPIFLRLLSSEILNIAVLTSIFYYRGGSRRNSQRRR